MKKCASGMKGEMKGKKGTSAKEGMMEKKSLMKKKK